MQTQIKPQLDKRLHFPFSYYFLIKIFDFNQEGIA